MSVENSPQQLRQASPALEKQQPENDVQSVAVKAGATQQKAKQASAVTCHNCGTTNDAESQYCLSCGAPLHGKVCPSCGSDLDADADFCEACHHYISHDVCSFCGAVVSDSDGYCPQCGSPRGGIVCPTCHTLNDFSFCKLCGQPLTDEARQLLIKVRESPEYRELTALAHEYNELQMELPFDSERDRRRDELSRQLRERVLKLLAEDEGTEPPTIPEPQIKRMTKQELEERKKRKMEQIAEILDRMALPQNASPAKVRNYAMAQKPMGVRLAWLCNYKNALHSSPCGCAKPQLGGKWVVLGHNKNQEIKDDK